MKTAYDMISDKFIHCGPEKTGHYIIGDNFVKCEPIFTTFAPLKRQLNFQQNPCDILHFTLTVVPHYLEKLERLICLTDYVMSCFYGTQCSVDLRLKA